MNGHDASQAETASARISFLLTQCDTLLSEISSLQSLLPDPVLRRGKNTPSNLSIPAGQDAKFPRHIWSPVIDLRPIRNAVVNEQRSLKKLHELSLSASKSSRDSKTNGQDVSESGYNGSDDESEDEDLADEKISHTLRSSNLPFHSTVWEVSKRRTGIVTYFYRAHLQKPEDGSAATPMKSKSKRGKAYRKRDAEDVDKDSSMGSTAAIGSMDQQAATNQKTPKGRRSQMVDIVANDGMEWIKVSTVTTARIELDKKKLEWEAGAFDLDTSDEDDDVGRKVTPALQSMYISSSPQDQRGPHSDDESSDDETEGEKEAMPELLRIARDLKTASLATRVNYVHPRVVFVLPNIIEGESDVVDAILSELRSTGATVECGEPPVSQFSPRTMLSDPKSELSSTLNIDCTILLALISDVSHLEHSLVTAHLMNLAKANAANSADDDSTPPPKDPHPAIQKQILLEKDDSLLQRTLYPILTHSPSTTLVTSSAAAQRCIDIASVIGTASEQRRASILFAKGQFSSSSHAELRAALQKSSIHPVPELHLPLKIIDVESENENETYLDDLPSYAPVVAQNLSDINKSVFMLGWARRWTTITSNKSVAKIMVDCVDGELDRLDQPEGVDGEVGKEWDRGPKLWVCAPARSLIGKESARRR